MATRRIAGATRWVPLVSFDRRVAPDPIHRDTEYTEKTMKAPGPDFSILAVWLSTSRPSRLLKERRARPKAEIENRTPRLRPRGENGAPSSLGPEIWSRSVSDPNLGAFILSAFSVFSVQLCVLGFVPCFCGWLMWFDAVNRINKRDETGTLNMARKARAESRPQRSTPYLSYDALFRDRLLCFSASPFLCLDYA